MVMVLGFYRLKKSHHSSEICPIKVLILLMSLKKASGHFLYLLDPLKHILTAMEGFKLPPVPPTMLMPQVTGHTSIKNSFKRVPGASETVKIEP